MEKFSVLEDLEDINGGGIVSACAGGAAGGMLGAFAGAIPSAVTGDAKYVQQGAIAGAAIGFWAGAGCPVLP